MSASFYTTLFLIGAIPEPCSSCDDRFRIGVGALYAQYRSVNAIDSVENLGGYVSAEARGYALSRRLQIVLDGHIGAAQASSIDSINANTATVLVPHNEAAVIGGFGLKFGVNLATTYVPLFFNLGYGLDGFGARRESGGFSRILNTVNVEIEGELPLGNRFTVEYGGGYGYVFGGVYGLPQSSRSLRIDGYSYVGYGYIGYAIKLSEHISYFMRATLKYYELAESRRLDLEATANRPVNLPLNYGRTENFVGMLEMGLGF